MANRKGRRPRVRMDDYDPYDIYREMDNARGRNQTKRRSHSLSPEETGREVHKHRGRPRGRPKGRKNDSGSGPQNQRLTFTELTAK